MPQCVAETNLVAMGHPIRGKHRRHWENRIKGLGLSGACQLRAHWNAIRNCVITKRGRWNGFRTDAATFTSIVLGWKCALVEGLRTVKSTGRIKM